MPAVLPRWCGDLHGLLPADLLSLVVALASILCGAAVGYERRRREKPAGMRTLMLVCLGSCIFTQAGMWLAGPHGDASRVASQVVTGIGFLGAGAIIRERGLVIGVTTGAAIWATAAIGVIHGTGHVAAGLVFTALILFTLGVERGLEPWLYGPCQFQTVRVDFDPADGRSWPLVQGVLDEHHAGLGGVEFPADGAVGDSVVVRYCGRHPPHRAWLTEMAALPCVRRITPVGGQAPAD